MGVALFLCGRFFSSAAAPAFYVWQEEEVDAGGPEAEENDPGGEENIQLHPGCKE